MEGIEEDLKVDDLAFFKYATITSVNVYNEVFHATKIYLPITDEVTNLSKLKKL